MDRATKLAKIEAIRAGARPGGPRPDGGDKEAQDFVIASAAGIILGIFVTGFVVDVAIKSMRCRWPRLQHPI
jgi:hypothetical protein